MENKSWKYNNTLFKLKEAEENILEKLHLEKEDFEEYVYQAYWKVLHMIGCKRPVEIDEIFETIDYLYPDVLKDMPRCDAHKPMPEEWKQLTDFVTTCLEKYGYYEGEDWIDK